MQSKKPKKLTPLQKPESTFLLVVVIAILLFGVFAFISRPKPSVAAFCDTYKKENAKLSKPKKASDEKWDIAGLQSSSSNPRTFLPALTKLEKVAPEDIEYDVRTLRTSLEKMDKEPSQQLLSGLGALGSESNIEAWTKNHCQL